VLSDSTQGCLPKDGQFRVEIVMPNQQPDIFSGGEREELCHLIIHQVRGKLRELIIILSLSAEKFVS
jgi:hypothetical protein